MSIPAFRVLVTWCWLARIGYAILNLNRSGENGCVKIKP